MHWGKAMRLPIPGGQCAVILVLSFLGIGPLPVPAPSPVRAGSYGEFPVQRNQEKKPMMKVLAIACLTVPAIVVSAFAQQPAIKRTVLRSIDYPAGYTTVTVIAEIAPELARAVTPIRGSTAVTSCRATSCSKSMGSPNRPLGGRHTRRRPRYRTTLARYRATS